MRRLEEKGAVFVESEEEIPPGEMVRVRFTPQKAGTFEFHFDDFCGSGHEEMNGRIVVKP